MQENDSNNAINNMELIIKLILYLCIKYMYIIEE